MSEIKLIIDNNEFYLEKTSHETFAFKIPRLLYNGFEYIALLKEKDIPKDWEVGTRVMDTWHSNCIYTKNDRGLWSCGNLDIFTIQYCEIGDECRFKLFEPYKPKVPLFTTEDGVEIFEEGEQVWMLNTKKWLYTFVAAPSKPFYGDGEQIKYFSTKEKLLEFKTLNKPIEVSYKEIDAFLKSHMEALITNLLSSKIFLNPKINE